MESTLFVGLFRPRWKESRGGQNCAATEVFCSVLGEEERQLIRAITLQVLRALKERYATDQLAGA